MRGGGPRILALGPLSGRAHWATPRVGSDRYVQVRRRGPACRRMGADRLPQLLDQAGRDHDRVRPTGVSCARVSEMSRHLDTYSRPSTGAQQTVPDIGHKRCKVPTNQGRRGHCPIHDRGPCPAARHRRNPRRDRLCAGDIRIIRIRQSLISGPGKQV